MTLLRVDGASGTLQGAVVERFALSVVDGAGGLHRRLADAAGLGRETVVRCRRCGVEGVVDGAVALAAGWPKHCGATMSLDVLPGGNISRASSGQASEGRDAG